MVDEILIRYQTMDRDDLLTEVLRLRAALLVAAPICGNNNCNCRGASKVKSAVKAALAIPFDR